MSKSSHETTRLEDLFPDLDAVELASAAEALDRYVDLTARIAERIAADPEALDRFSRLTQGPGNPTMTDTSISAPDQ